MSDFFSEDQVEAIAKALGDTNLGLSNTEIDTLLQQSRIHDDHGPGTKWQRLRMNMWNQQVRDGHRLSILAFIRKSMKPARYIQNPEKFLALKHNLNIALAFCGMEVDDTGTLSLTNKIHTLSEAERRANELREDLSLRKIHEDVLSFCKSEYLADDYFHAVLEAVKSVFDKMRRLSGIDKDGSELIDACFCGKAPLLFINAHSTETERMEQRGFSSLLKGIYGTFRNPTAHEARIKWPMTKEDAEDIYQ
ncbi:TIGR02391 family protein [Nitratidesulfovibrio vulgaris]|uniref:TIGR02391 family protein n=1 Tax=Nitratidesulfovibrio vulgaris TaxID=881 RepID=UPI0022FFD312|nr:TIGR02391 family protein [Nitratidesulfovibrio vulgaris]WCB45697.1 TIGR02391 family protein [Nitratidesulfovibrio vulgaris]